MNIRCVGFHSLCFSRLSQDSPTAYGTPIYSRELSRWTPYGRPDGYVVATGLPTAQIGGCPGSPPRNRWGSW
jgi:hypothetical protein